MPDFRYYCLSDNNRIILGAYVEATDLDSAIRAAYEACRDHPHVNSTRIEVWQGPNRLYVTAGAVCGPSCAGPP